MYWDYRAAVKNTAVIAKPMALTHFLITLLQYNIYQKVLSHFIICILKVKKYGHF